MMRTSHKTAARHHRARHLVFGSGGTRAFLNGAGAMFACHLGGVREWLSVGGVSGGSIPALLVAAGIHPREIVRHSVETDFSELLEQHDTIGNLLKARFLRRKSARRMLRHGIVRSNRLGEHLESVVPQWPEKFWTMAVSGKRQFLFTADGVYLYRRGRCRKLLDQPAPIGLAIRASCAVPGIIEAVEYAGHVLFDGALSRYGACPTELATRHFGADFDDIVAVDLVRRGGNRRDRFIEMIARTLSGTLRQKPALPFDAPTAGLCVRTDMEVFNSLDFNITIDRKQRAVLAGFRACIEELRADSVIDDQQYMDLYAHSETWELFEQLLSRKDPEVQPQEEPAPAPKRRRRWFYLWLK